MACVNVHRDELGNSQDPLLRVGPRAPSLSGCLTAASLGGQATCFAPSASGPFLREQLPCLLQGTVTSPRRQSRSLPQAWPVSTQGPGPGILHRTWGASPHSHPLSPASCVVALPVTQLPTQADCYHPLWGALLGSFVLRAKPSKSPVGPTSAAPHPYWHSAASAPTSRSAG